MMDYQIKIYSEEDQQEVLNLHQVLFEDIYREEFPQKVQRLKADLDEGHCLLAAAGDHIVAFGGYTFTEEIFETYQFVDHLKKFIGEMEQLANGSVKTQEIIDKIAEELYSKYVLEFGGKPALELFNNQMSNYQPSKNECELRTLAVAPAYQRQGIARALTTRFLERSQELGIDAVFINTLEQSGSREIAESLGFQPIFHKGPCFPRGRGVTLLGRRVGI
ncbi:GNAT family N-acetyltransferase [Candidatus Woesearchaeota archaeon]|nr:GNAT family N-acetyltransferase [Candidatus Woesearchaeota archaeon]